MRLTSRDEAMLDWLDVVRMADMDAIRWALGGLSGAGEPVSTRRAQQWVARVAEVGLVDRTRPTFRDGAIVWATHQAIGRPAPNFFRMTTRHEVAVAAISARYLARGFVWRRDRRAATVFDHQADGVATRGSDLELVEVELTAKNVPRYKQICENHAFRLANEGVTKVAYYCSRDAARVVAREADRLIFRTERAKLETHLSFDVRGRWIGSDLNSAEPHHAGMAVNDVLDGSASWGVTSEVTR